MMSPPASGSGSPPPEDVLGCVLDALPASAEWTVVFDLAEIVPLADPPVIRAMFFLPATQPLTEVGHIVLTPDGPALADKAGRLTAPGGAPWPETAVDTDSLLVRYRSLLELLEWRGALCIGVGVRPPFAPVALVVHREGDQVIGTAAFSGPPDTRHYGLLAACGVRYLGGAERSGAFLARFENTLPIHIYSGLLARFSRTGHCNDFFLRHGDIDVDLADGLRHAADGRIRAARGQAVATLAGMAVAARKTPMAMTCRPPLPAAPEAYGDLVPLGFVARALAAAGEQTAAAGLALLRRHLVRAGEGGLWAFHSGRLITATDSALVSLGMTNPGAVEALERFSDGAEGYVPQLWADDDRPGHMRRTDATRHWCQTDFGTTCLIRALRRECGLETRTGIAWIAERFERRGSLFFANPYLMDWTLAVALADDCDPQAETLRRRLADEVAASVCEDGAFGVWDRALSTVFAILTLTALGRTGEVVRRARLRLLDLVDDVGRWPVSTPFYSTLALPGEAMAVPGLLHVRQRWYALSLYDDAFAMIGTAVAALALADIRETCSEEETSLAVAHPRYRCSGIADYVRRFALPPYLGDSRA